MPQSTIGPRLKPGYGPRRQLQFVEKYKSPGEAIVGGMSLITASAVVLISSTDGFPRPPDTTQALHAFRAAAPAAQLGQPWQLWQPSNRLLDPEFSIQRANHDALHQFRETFQTVGQPWASIFQRTVPRLEPESFEVRRPDRESLHIFRVGYQTVGQPWQTLFTVPAPRLEPESYLVRPVDQTPLYGRTTPAVVTAGAPWYLWQNTPQLAAAEWEIRRSDHDLLHRYRTSFQTVGQPWRILFPQTQVRLEAEWVVNRFDHGQLHLYRTGFQTVGQPWNLLWPRTNADVRLEPESYRITPTDQTPLFGHTLTFLAQPWNAYNWQTPPPDTSADLAFDYRSVDFWSALFPFLITPTTPIIPPVEPDLQLGPMGPLYPSGIAAQVSHQIDKLKGAKKRKRHEEPESEQLTPAKALSDAHSTPAPVTLADAIDPASLKELQHLAEQLRATKGLIVALDEEMKSQREIEEAIALLLLLMHM